jgi:hypothetical protein
MQDKDNVERPYTLIFPEAKAYAVDDVLNFILAVECPCDPDRTNNNAEYRNEFKAYLIERLLKSVIEGKFELWDSYLKKVVAPPIKNSGRSTEVLAESLKPSPVNTFWQFLSKTFSRPPEPSFIQALENPAIVPHNRISRIGYKEDLWWARMTSILKPDLVKFCNDERILVTFEGEGEQAIAPKDNQAAQGQISDSQDVLTNSQGQPKERWRLANAGQLAEAFKVLNDPDKNLKWFKNNCTNHEKNSAFEDALVISGKPGAGNANLFDVLVLLGHLESNKKRQTNSAYFKHPHYRNYLRAQVMKYFPRLLDEFDDRFGTGDNA